MDFIIIIVIDVSVYFRLDVPRLRNNRGSQSEQISSMVRVCEFVCVYNNTLGTVWVIVYMFLYVKINNTL